MVVLAGERGIGYPLLIHWYFNIVHLDMIYSGEHFPLRCGIGDDSDLVCDRRKNTCECHTCKDK